MNQTKNEKFRLPLAIILSITAIFIINKFFPMQSENKNIQKQQTSTSQSYQNNAVVNKNSSKTTRKNRLKKLVNFKETFPTLENSNMKIVFSTKNGIIISNILKSNTYNNVPIDLENNFLSNYHTGMLNLGDNIKQLSDIQYYRITKQLSNIIVFETDEKINNHKCRIIKTFKLDGYELNLKVQIKNNDRNGGLFNFFVINGSSIGINHWNQSKRSSIEKLSSFDGNDISDPLNLGLMSGTTNLAIVQGGTKWISMDNRFYCRYMESDNINDRAYFYYRPSSRYTNQISAYQATMEIDKGVTKEKNYKIISLPKSRALLNKLSDKYQDKKYYEINDQSSIMRFLSEMMYYFIIFINSIIGNFGYSIIIMTLIIKIVTFPLNQKSYTSMQKMQELQPKIAKIKENNKNNPKQAQIEQMNLYKKDKINPLSGCFPMLIPIPIFIALYYLFLNMIELNNQSFLWIKDLTLPDTIYTFSFSIPFLGNTLKILPILMVISSLLQSMSTPQATQENAQAKMMKYMFPIIFFFICWDLPSALVLFWTLNGLFSYLQTLLVKKKKLKS